ncbi:HlyD family secretion protein [Roseimaritima ulvae]|uniref:HlyD family secretion protein n=1 Tax=Roseimaritima ulvae TaxID=980254 RepID=A0A5B9QK17_9BACT|nr:HlyD family efflux transporter periplasmic adaptor subunit [Roseimaritima ulvae]QEG39447.1 HlyD family secretion protein [Roseimaritima ulvae]
MNDRGTVACLLLLACSWWWATAPTDAAAQGDPAAHRQPITGGVQVDDCVIRYSEEIDVPAAESGILENVLIEPNHEVEADQPLAMHNTDQLLLQRRIAELQKKAADEKLADDLELQYARTALEEAQAELESNRSIYETSGGAVPFSMLRKLRLAVKRAELEVEREKKQRRLAQVEIDLRAADLQMLQQQAERLVIKSPLPGVVLEVYRHTGEWVTAGDPVARIARLDRLHAHCLLTADRLPPRLCKGQAVTARWTEQGVERSLRGRVMSVDTEMLANGSYRLHAELQNVLDGDHWRLLPGTEVIMTVHPVASPTVATGPGARRSNAPPSVVGGSR